MEEKEKFIAEITELAKKYKVENFSFCGKHGENFFASTGINAKTESDFFECVLHIARLYQSAREKTLGMLNEIIR